MGDARQRREKRLQSVRAQVLPCRHTLGSPGRDCAMCAMVHEWLELRALRHLSKLSTEDYKTRVSPILKRWGRLRHQPYFDELVWDRADQILEAESG